MIVLSRARQHFDWGRGACPLRYVLADGTLEPKSFNRFRNPLHTVRAGDAAVSPSEILLVKID